MFSNKIESRHLLNPQSIQYQCGDSIKKGHERRKGSSRGSGAVKPQNLYHGEPPPSLQHGDQVQARRPLGPYTHFSPHPGNVTQPRQLLLKQVAIVTMCFVTMERLLFSLLNLFVCGMLQNVLRRNLVH